MSATRWARCAGVSTIMIGLYRWTNEGALCSRERLHARLESGLPEVASDEVPVDEIVEDRVDELAAIVAVVDVVGVLPDVDGQQGGLAVLERGVGVAGAHQRELAAVRDQPTPAGAEGVEAGRGEVGLELVVGAEVLLDLRGEVATRLTAAAGLEAG